MGLNRRGFLSQTVNNLYNLYQSCLDLNLENNSCREKNYCIFQHQNFIKEILFTSDLRFFVVRFPDGGQSQPDADVITDFIKGP